MSIKRVKIRPLHPHAALLLESERKHVVITDLHIGLEADLLDKGIAMPSIVPEMSSELLKLVNDEHADRVILLGDIKHTIGAVSRQEWDDIPLFLKQVAEKADVYFVPGNHDSNIRHLLPSSIITTSPKGMTIGDTLLIHGHTLPSDVRSNVSRIVMGHVHPVFVKKGSVLHGKRVWVYFQAEKETLFPSEQGLIEIVIVPSFNSHLYATGVNYKKSISPIVARALQGKVEKCVIATLDGSVVGDSSLLRSIL